MKTKKQVTKSFVRYAGGWAVLFFLMTANGFAQKNSVLDSTELKVKFLNEENGFLNFQATILLPQSKTNLLRISNQDNELLYTERISETAFQKVYRFPKQEEGEIRFVLTGGKEPLRKYFSVQTKTEDRYFVNEIAGKN